MTNNYDTPLPYEAEVKAISFQAVNIVFDSDGKTSSAVWIQNPDKTSLVT